MRILIRANTRSLSLPFTSTLEAFPLTMIGGMTMLLSELQHPFDVVGLSEAKIKDSCDPARNITINGYNFISKPTLTNAGGVGFYVKEGIPFNV